MCIFGFADSGKLEIALKANDKYCSCIYAAAPLSKNFCLTHTVEKMARRNVLITGCSSGIGMALAVKMAKDEQERFKGNNISVIFLYEKYMYFSMQ